MRTPYTTRLAGLVVAVVMTAATHGAMLWQFDGVAQSAAPIQCAQTPVLATLDTVVVVARRS